MSDKPKNIGFDNVTAPFGKGVVVGKNLTQLTSNQVLLGTHNDISGDASADILQIGAGTENEKQNVFRVDRNGNPTIMGGEVFYDATVGSIVMRVPIYMEGFGKDASAIINKKVYI